MIAIALLFATIFYVAHRLGATPRPIACWPSFGLFFEKGTYESQKCWVAAAWGARYAVVFPTHIDLVTELRPEFLYRLMENIRASIPPEDQPRSYGASSEGVPPEQTYQEIPEGEIAELVWCTSDPALDINAGRALTLALNRACINNTKSYSIAYSSETSFRAQTETLHS